jgi:hypothetical protein
MKRFKRHVLSRIEQDEILKIGKLKPALQEEAISQLLKDVLFLYCAYQIGKGGRDLGPILIPADLVPAIDCFIAMRKIAGVARGNTFLFACTQHSDDNCRGWDEVTQLLKSQLLKPKLITATKMRHRASTYSTYLNLSPAEQSAFIAPQQHSFVHSYDTFAERLGGESDGTSCMCLHLQQFTDCTFPLCERLVFGGLEDL